MSGQCVSVLEISAHNPLNTKAINKFSERLAGSTSSDGNLYTVSCVTCKFKLTMHLYFVENTSSIFL